MFVSFVLISQSVSNVLTAQSVQSALWVTTPIMEYAQYVMWTVWHVQTHQQIVHNVGKVGMWICLHLIVVKDAKVGV